MSEKIICWRGTDGDVQPIKCVCDDKFGYPNYCTDESGKNDKMYDNTHFLEKEKAWYSIYRSVRAGISLSGSRVIQAKKQLEEAEKEAGNAVTEYELVRKNENNPYAKDM